MNVYELKFASEHVEPIINGEMFSTLRHGLEVDPENGDKIDMVDAETGERFARGTVRLVGTISAERFVKGDTDGHHTYDDVGDLLSHLRRYYPDASLEPETRLTHIQWEPDPELDDEYMRMRENSRYRLRRVKDEHE